MMLIEETHVPQSALPVAAFKAHLRLASGFADDDAQDAGLESYLRAAMAAIEARTGKILIAREFSWTLTRWRDACRQPLPVAPVSAVSQVTLVPVEGDDVPVTGWSLAPDDQRPCLQGNLPPVPHGGSVRIGMLAGYGPEWSDLPPDLAQAVLMLAAHFYEFRHDMTRGAPVLPFGVASLIDRYRTVRLFMGGRV